MPGEVPLVNGWGSATIPGAEDGDIICAANPVNFTEVNGEVAAVKFVMAWSKWSHPATYEDLFGGMGRLYVSLESR